LKKVIRSHFLFKPNKNKLILGEGGGEKWPYLPSSF
jgi:hypothetical protein